MLHASGRRERLQKPALREFEETRKTQITKRTSYVIAIEQFMFFGQ